MVQTDNARWARILTLLDEALQLEPAQRATWLSEVEAGDAPLAAELRGLLALHAANSASGFMERSPLERVENLAGARIGPYLIERLLGRGGMGSVWLARRNDGKFEGRAAIKVLERRGLGRDAARAISHEASLLARLTHPNIARLFDAGVTESGQPYLILEYVEGEIIDAYCRTRALPLAATLRLFITVVDAVAHAHAHLVVHRDLKPSNVLVTAEGVVKLLDFGVASLQAGSASGETETPRALTPGYAAPEQLRGEPVAAAADVYALGVLLHVLVTGEHPFGARGTTETELMRAALADDPALASERLTGSAERRRVRGDLDAIIARALNRDPLRRYPTAAELAEDVRAYLGRFPVRARPATRVYVAHKFAQRHWGGVLSVVLTLLVLLAATVVTTLQTLEARRQRDFAHLQLGRAEAINDLTYYVINDAGPAGEPIVARGLLARAEHVLERQRLNDANRVVLLTSIGWEYEAEGDHVSGMRVLNQAYALSRALSEPSARARAACALGNALANEKSTPRSEALIAEGLRELPEAPEFALDRASCLERAQQVASNAGDGRLAVQRSQQALEVLKQVPFPHEVAELHADEELAAALDESGRYRDAAAAFAAGWSRLVALGRDDTVGAHTWLNNWAADLLRLGRPLEAEALQRRVIDLEESGTPGQETSATTLSAYAQTLIELSRIDEAADFADRAYSRALHLDNPTAIAQTRLRLARIYRARRDFVRAAAMLDAADAGMRRLLPPGHYAFGALTAERALIARDQGDPATAQTQIDAAVQLDEQAARNGNAGAEYVPVLLIYRASIEFAAQRMLPADADLRRALELLRAKAQPGDYSVYVGRAELMLARVLIAEGKAGDARHEAQRAAQQLTQSEGPEHPETRAALQLGQAP
jgi:eukaryotic-like serine/threonine-protein kinase